jgi:hypothetical protein
LHAHTNGQDAEYQIDVMDKQPESIVNYMDKEVEELSSMDYV